MMRRVFSTLFGLGKTTAAPVDTGTVQTVQVRLNQYELLDARPVVIAYGLVSCPPVGSDVLLTCVSNDRANGVVTGHNHQQYRYTGAQPGEVGLANMVAKSTVILKANGDIVITPGSGNVKVAGVMQATDFQTTDGIKLSDHLHRGVQSGASNTQGPIEP